MRVFVGLASGLLGLCLMLGWGIPRQVIYLGYAWNCEEYLERAANANTIQLAAENLDKALEYIEANHLTSGNTGIIFKTPENDVSYWYANLKAARKELDTAKNSDDNQLRDSNILIKLRETLTDNGEHGTKIIVAPKAIDAAPNNVAWAITGFIAIIGGIILIMAGLIFLLSDSQ